MTVIDRHEVRASIQNDSLTYDDLEVITDLSGRIRLDRNTAPAVEGTLYVVSPADPFAWDPRAFYRRVRITVLQRFGDVANFLEDLTDTYGGGTLADLTTDWAGDTLADLTNQPGRYYSPTTLAPTSREFDLCLRRVNHRLDGITELTVRSDEILLIDRLYTRIGSEGGAADQLATTYSSSRFLANGGTFSGWLTSIVAFVSGVGPQPLWQNPVAVGAEDIPVVTVGDDVFSSTKLAELSNDAIVPMGTNGWDMVRDLAASLGLRVFSDGSRGLIIDRINATTGRTVVVDKDLNLLDFEFTIDLDAPGYAAKVAARYPSDTPGDPDEFYVSINFTTNPFIYPPAGPGIIIDRAGTAVVEVSSVKGGGSYSTLTGSRAVKLAIQAPVTAVNQYGTVPGDALTIIGPAVELAGEVDAVEFEIGGTWQMTITATNLEETP